MALFDDLIPEQGGVARKASRPSTTGAGLFDDLMPAAAAPATVAPTAVRPATAKGEESSWLESAGNVAAGAGERAFDLMGGMGDSMLAGLEAAGADMENPFIANLRRGTERAKDMDFGYEEATSWDDFKAAPLRNFVPFALEQGLVSTPDMAAALYALPAYIAARAGELGDQRAENNEIENATIADLVATLPAAAASALLERFGARGMIGLDDVAIRSLKEVPGEVGKAAIKEGLTEAGQEGIEYTGTNLGTKKGFDVAEAGEQMLAGAVGGVGFGGAIRTGTATAQALRPAGTSDTLPDGAAPAEDFLGEETVVPVPADRERLNSPRLTDDDRASPIPNDLIDDGKGIFDGSRTMRSEPGLPEPDMTDPDLSELEEAFRQDVQEDKRAAEASEPSFMRDLTPDQRAAYLATPGINRAVARSLGTKIDELEAKGDGARAEKLRGKLADILGAFGISRAPRASNFYYAAAEPDFGAGFDADIQAAAGAAPTMPQGGGLAPTSMRAGDGSRTAPVAIRGAADLEGVADRVAAAPTDGQKAAGNYQKAHGRWNGLTVSIENPRGSQRTGTDANGKGWSVTMPAHYGDFKGTNGNDGDPVDVYVGENPSSQRVFVLDQKDADTGAFDEVKVVIGANSEAEVAEIYNGAFSDGRAGDRLQGITETSIANLKDWLKNGNAKVPFGEYSASPKAKRERIAALPKKPVIKMLRDAGGVDPSSALAGNLRAMDITPRTAPGLFKTGGMGAADNFVREEHELFVDGPDDGNGYILEEEIIEALRREMGGDPLRTAAEFERAMAAQPQQLEADADVDPDARQAPARDRRVDVDPDVEVDRLIEVYGYPDSPELRQTAISFVERGLNPEDAIVAAAERMIEEKAQPDEADTADADIGIPFFRETDADGETVGRDVPVVQEPGDGEAGAGGRADGNGAARSGEREGAGRAEDARTVEAGADGKPQLVIPGAERASDRDMAQRGADSRMRPNANQQAMDEGLFGSSSQQTDLLDMKPRPLPNATAPEQVTTGVDDRERQRAENVRKLQEREAPKSVVTDEETATVNGWLETLAGFVNDPDWGKPVKRTAQTIAQLLESANAGDMSYIDQVLDRRNPFAINRYSGKGSKVFETTEAISDDAYDLFNEIGKRIDKSAAPTQTAPEGATTDGRTETLANDGEGTPRGASADAAPRVEGQREAGDVARSARERDASADGNPAQPGNERSGSVGDRTRDADAEAGAGSGRADAGRGDAETSSGRVRNAGRGSASDFRITSPEEIGAGGQKTKFDNNLAAISLLYELGGMKPTEDQKRVLARYVGWGGIPQAFKRPDGTYAEGWQDRAQKLEAALSKDALAAARRSTQDAHYTSPQVVNAIWSAAQQVGFKGGRVLEPSVGVGNFIGLRPEGVNARFTAVEYDDTTAAIAKALYGASDVHHQGFQDFTAPDGYFDLAIGNPPFGSQKLFDKRRPHLNSFSIHNMFFAKSIDLLRADGVLAMVVSNSFLDAVVKDKARKYIASKAEFLGAIRLPNNAFSKNAGTEVTTDIIFLRKLKADEAPTGESWISTEYVPDPNGGAEIPLNEYFVRNPDMMLGDFGSYGSMYRAGTTALVAREGQDLAADLNVAIAKLPRDVMGDWSKELVERSNAAQVDKAVKVGSMFLDANGDVAVRNEDFGTEQRAESVGLTGKQLERATGLIKIRDVLTELRGMQLTANADERAMEKARAALNREYDAFVKKNGPISADANRRVFGEDPTWPQLAALEDNFDKGIMAAVAKSTGEKPRAPSAEKAAIFTKRTQAPYAPPTKAGSAKDALTASLSVTGRVDLDFMSRLTSRSETALLEELDGLLFKTPIGEVVTREEYLSGNVKQKLREAREAAAQDRAFAGNVEALDRVQPADIEAADIDVKPGAHWVPPQYVEAFVNHITGGGGAKASYSRLTGQWAVSLGKVAATAEVEYGTDRADIGATLRAALEQRAVQVYDNISRTERVLNQEASEAATEKSRRIADEWRRWIWTDDARRRDMATIYNEQFNTTVAREFDGSHLTFPGKVGDDIIALRPHQKNAVWRIVQGGTTLLDHVVGAGKTFTMIAGAMELRRTGFARKPMLVVPNHLVGQWAEDFVRLYPGARILAATKKDFEAKNRKRLFARIATGDWDAVIIAHSSFGKVDLDPEFLREMLDEQLRDIEDAIQEMKDSSKGEATDDRTVKQAEKQREALKERLEKMAESGAKDDNLTLGELGVDALFLDEAHEFKNLPFVTKQRGVMGLGNPAGSQKAMDMFLKTQFILRRNGNRNVVHATGTPISNTMAEMYTVGRYLDYQDMRDRGVIHFDAWARQFGEVVTDWEISPSGRYKLTARFAKFVNMPEMMQRYLTFADVINRDEINRQLASQGKKLPIPKIKGGKPQNIIVPRSDDQAVYIGIPLKDADGNDTETYPEGSLVWRTENMPKRPEKGADNMLKIMGDARKAALDMRLVDKGYGDNPKSKIHEAANRIKALYDKWTPQKGAQLVFIDLSTPKAAKGKEAARIRELLAAAEGNDAAKAEAAQEQLDRMSPDEIDALNGDFSVYDDLKAKLIARGIPEAEIAFIHDANTELQKDELFGRVRSGRVRVLFGSTAKMGAGMNVQNRLVGLHHMDAPWRPSDLEQREGRIIRQGNELYAADPDGFEVEINRYATERTLDARMWQTIEAKARFIEQVRKGAGGREIEDVGGEAANAAEMKAAASGNPAILEEMSLRKTLRALENQRREHVRGITRTADTIDMMKRSNARLSGDVPRYRADAKVNTKELNAKIGKKTFDKIGEAAEAAVAEMRKRIDKGATQGDLGSVWGLTLRFDVTTSIPYLSVDSQMGIEAPAAMEDSPLGALMKLRNALNNSDGYADAAEAKVAEQEREIAQLEARGEPAWPKEAEFQETKARHEALVAALRPKTKTAAAKPATSDDDAQLRETPAGWGEVDGGTEPATRLTDAEQRAVLDIVRRVSGLSDVEFHEAIQIPSMAKGFRAWGREGKEGEFIPIAGFYHRMKDMIAIALNSGGDGKRLAFHESFHRVQAMFLTDQEKALLAAESEALRSIIAATLGREAQAANMAQIELEAEAFAIYAERMDAGGNAPLRLKGRIRAAWDRIRAMSRRVRNYLNGRGYQTFEDVFDLARSGEMTARNPDGTVAKVDSVFSEMDGAQFDIAPDFTGPDAEPQRRAQSFLAKGQPLDRAIRAPFDWIGGLNANNEWKPGRYLTDRAAKVITTAKFDPDGRFSWLNGTLETARAGLIDRHGLDPEYVDRDRRRGLDERRVMMQGAEVLKSLAEQNVGMEEAKVLQAILTGEAVDDAAMSRLAEPIRKAIDELGQEAVQIGLLSAESYERNRGAYLHRVYMKHEAEENGLTRMVSKIMGNSRKKIIGDQFKGRGMFFAVAPDALTRSDREFAAGRRGAPQNGDKFRVLEEVQTDMLGGTSKVVRRVYLPANQKVPADYAAFRDQGVWELRGKKDGKPVLWRDYTKAEREKMGEILDARYTIGKTYTMMAHDLATGRFYQDIATNEDWTRTSEPEGKWKNAGDVSRMAIDPELQWVRVPDAVIPSSGGKKRWGALAGKFVRAEIWRDLNEIEVMNRPTTWRMLLTQWKLNKTARSPVVHMNNVMSNLMFMDLADIRMQDLKAGVRSYATGDRHYQEAVENGAFGSDMMSQEMRDNVLKPVLKEIAKSVRDSADDSFTGRSKMLGKVAETIATTLKTLDQKMIDAYRVEDEVFRMATYMRRRQLGDAPKAAADFARQQFLDYDIRAPWVNAARNTVLPFISYTYRAAPLVAQAIATRPWKLAKYAMVGYAVNALAYAMADDDDEERERASLREQERGTTWLGLPRMLRMPFNSSDDLPVFLDIRRWIPAGDVFDTNQGSGALPIPAPLQFGGPLMIGAEIALNKQGFTGDEITNSLTDTWFDKAGKVGDYLWKSVMPSAAWVPNSWYWQKIGNAAAGATDATGRPYDLPTAIASSIGIKLKPQDVDSGLHWRFYDLQKVKRELDSQLRTLGRQRERGLISQKAFDKGVASIVGKFGRLEEEGRELGEASRRKQ